MHENQAGSRKIFVYIAGPYTKPSPAHNVNRATDAGDALLAAGLVPFIPHLYLLWDTISPKPYESWLALDFHWLEKCDCVLRLPGESAGSDREEDHARSKGIEVFYSVTDVVRHYSEKKAAL